MANLPGLVAGSVKPIQRRDAQVSGWLKAIRQLRKLHDWAPVLANWVFVLQTLAYDLIRMWNSLEAIA